MTIDVDALRATVDLSALAGRVTKLIKNGKEFTGLCPFHSERSPSFSVYPKGSGWGYHCFGCGAGGDCVDFVMQLDGVDFREACTRLGAGNVVALRPRDSGAAPEPVGIYDGLEIIPPPIGAPPLVAGKQTPPIWNPKRDDDAKRRMGQFKPSLVHPYRDAAGTLLGYVLRHDLAEGRKETPAIQWVAGKGWARVPFREPRPLYGLDLLAARPKAPVLVVEGEKCADAARDLLKGYVTVTWAGGSNAWRKTDWTPLHGREVLIWPDADQAGWDASRGISEALVPYGGIVRIVKTWGAA